jgi:hypothetical protein
MQKLHRRSLFWSLLASAASFACSSGRTEDGASVYVAPATVADPTAPGVPTDDPTDGSNSGPVNAPVMDSETADPDLDLDSPGGSKGAGTSDGVGGSSEVIGAGGSTEMTGSGGSGVTMPEEERIVLFDGTNLDAWISRNTGGPVGWRVEADGSMVVSPGTGDIITRQEFEDVFVHAEYKTPVLPVNVTGQDRGNSGIYLKGMYEVQVLDSFGNEPEVDGCGSIYGIQAPLTVACFQEEVWNTYEIEFQAPRYDDAGVKVSDARMLLVTLNDVVVQRDTVVPRGTAAGYAEAPGPAGIMLQDHGNRLWFRNIWVIPR